MFALEDECDFCTEKVSQANFSSQDLSMGASDSLRANARSIFETCVVAAIRFPTYRS
jgi:hypothetical protein